MTGATDLASASNVGPATRTNFRVLLVDDAPSTRRFLSAVLDSVDRVEVIGEADNGRTAIDSAERLQPELVLLDLSLPDTDGAQVLPELLRVAPRARVVILSSKAEAAGPALVRLGATGFIEKGLSPTDLLDRLSGILGAELSSGSVVRSTRPTRAVPMAAVICDSDPLTRRQMSWVLARCDVRIVSEIVSDTDAADALRFAVETIRPAVVIVGDIEGDGGPGLVTQLQQVSPTSSVIAYTARLSSAVTGPSDSIVAANESIAAAMAATGFDARDKVRLVAQPDLEHLERTVRQSVAARS